MERRDGEDRRADSITWRDLHQAFKDHDRADAEALEKIEKGQTEILTLLRGDGSDTKPGLLVRVDRIEQEGIRHEQDRRRQAGFHAIWFTSLVAWLFDHFGTGG